MTDRLKPDAIQAEACRLHAAEGHPEGYEGPCWGPTLANIEQAKANLAAAQPDPDTTTRRPQ